jgi:hypothetical protein
MHTGRFIAEDVYYDQQLFTLVVVPLVYVHESLAQVPGSSDRQFA